MQLIRGNKAGGKGIGWLMANPQYINELYAGFTDKSDLAVGGESASLSDILTGRNRNTAAANINTGQLSAADQAARIAAMMDWETGKTYGGTPNWLQQNPLYAGWEGRQGLVPPATTTSDTVLPAPDGPTLLTTKLPSPVNV